MCLRNRVFVGVTAICAMPSAEVTTTESLNKIRQYNWSKVLRPHMSVSVSGSHPPHTTAAATALDRQANPSTINNPRPAIAAPAREIAG